MSIKSVIKKDLNYWILLLIFIIAGGIFLALYGKEDTFLILNGFGRRELNDFFAYATYLGDGRTLVLFGLLCVFLSYKRFIQAIFCLGVPSLITIGLKSYVFHAVNRPTLHFHATGTEFYTVPDVQMLIHLSFPSGHTTAAFAMFTCAALFLRNKSINYILFLAALIAGASRIYLGQHFFTDVFVGAQIGSFACLVTFVLLERYFERNPKNWYAKSILKR